MIVQAQYSITCISTFDAHTDDRKIAYCDDRRFAIALAKTYSTDTNQLVIVGTNTTSEKYFYAGRELNAVMDGDDICYVALVHNRIHILKESSIGFYLAEQ